MGTAQILKLARDDIAREGGFTSRAYGTPWGAKCMCGSISNIENGHCVALLKTHRSAAWEYVIRASRMQHPLRYWFRARFLGTPRKFIPERMVMKTTGGRWTALRIMKKAIKMAEKDERRQTKKQIEQIAEFYEHLQAKRQIADEAEKIVRSAAKSVTEDDNTPVAY